MLSIIINRQKAVKLFVKKKAYRKNELLHIMGLRMSGVFDHFRQHWESIHQGNAIIMKCSASEMQRKTELLQCFFYTNIKGLLTSEEIYTVQTYFTEDFEYIFPFYANNMKFIELK